MLNGLEKTLEREIQEQVAGMQILDFSFLTPEH